ncbi:Solute carrier family 22 member 3, partial [Armadillidium nasatum]
MVGSITRIHCFQQLHQRTTGSVRIRGGPYVIVSFPFGWETFSALGPSGLSVTVVEYCGVKSRVIPLLTIMMTYTIASILAPLLAWLIWDWKLILILTTIPNVVILIFYRYLPESPSWMITKKKLEKAAKQLEYVGNVNKSPIEKKELLLKLTNVTSEKSEVSPEDKYDDATSPSLMNILKFPKLRRNIMVVLLI